MMEEESVLSQHYRIFFGWDNKRGLFNFLHTVGQDRVQLGHGKSFAAVSFHTIMENLLVLHCNPETLLSSEPSKPPEFL